MQMIRHQDVSTDKDATLQTSPAELLEVLVDCGFREDGPTILRASGDEVERMADEKPVEPLEPLWLPLSSL